MDLFCYATARQCQAEISRNLGFSILPISVQQSVMIQPLPSLAAAAMQCQNTADAGMVDDDDDRAECRRFSALQFLKKTP